MLLKKHLTNTYLIFSQVNDDVCQLRLDFEKLELAGPDNTSSCSIDTFTFVGSAGANPTVICGDNTGQHSKYGNQMMWKKCAITVKGGEKSEYNSERRWISEYNSERRWTSE